MTIRNAGFVACLVGVLIMVGSRYARGVPPVFVSVGVGIIVLGWGLFALSALRRNTPPR